MVGDGDGAVDDVRGFAVRSKVRSARSNAFCSDGERRLETRAVSGIDDELTVLRVRAREWSQRVHGREGKVRSREGAASTARPRRNLEL
jgi:hypothetical protein